MNQQTATLNVKAELEIIEVHLNLNDNTCKVKSLLFPLGKESGSQPTGCYTEFVMDDDVRTNLVALLLRHTSATIEINPPTHSYTENERV